MAGQSKKDSIDYALFGGCIYRYLSGDITNKMEICRIMGVCQPTMDKYWDYWNEQLDEKIRSGEIRQLKYEP